MAVYVDEALLLREFKEMTVGASTPISTSDVLEFIDQEEVNIELELAGVYSIPITGTRSVKLMKRMVTFMVKARILDIITVKTGNKDTEQGDPGDGLRALVMDPEEGMLAKIKDKRLPLLDATLLRTGGAMSSYNNDNGVEAEIEKDEVQW